MCHQLLPVSHSKECSSHLTTHLSHSTETFPSTLGSLSYGLTVQTQDDPRYKSEEINLEAHKKLLIVLLANQLDRCIAFHGLSLKSTNDGLTLLKGTICPADFDMLFGVLSQKHGCVMHEFL